MAKYVGPHAISIIGFLVLCIIGFLVAYILDFFKTPFIYLIICCVIVGIMCGGAWGLYKLKKKNKNKRR